MEVVSPPRRHFGYTSDAPPSLDVNSLREWSVAFIAMLCDLEHVT